jgi:hypothetical protein
LGVESRGAKLLPIRPNNSKTQGYACRMRHSAALRESSSILYTIYLRQL